MIYPKKSVENKYLFADYKIPQVETGNGFFRNIDLFQVIFDTNIHSIL
jgi:hypothetical protein